MDLGSRKGAVLGKGPLQQVTTGRPTSPSI